MAYSLITLIGGALLIAATPFVAMGEGMAWWTWGILSGVGCTAGIFVHVWRGGKDEKSRRETGWRSIFGVAGGLGIPRFILLTWPWVAHVTILNDPIIIVVGGFVCFMLCSYACLGWMRWLEKDAPKVGYRQGKALERKSDQYTEPTDQNES